MVKVEEERCTVRFMGSLWARSPFNMMVIQNYLISDLIWTI